MEILELRIRKLYNISGKEIFDQRWEKAERKQHYNRILPILLSTQNMGYSKQILTQKVGKVLIFFTPLTP